MEAKYVIMPGHLNKKAVCWQTFSFNEHLAAKKRTFLFKLSDSNAAPVIVNHFSFVIPTIVPLILILPASFAFDGLDEFPSLYDSMSASRSRGRGASGGVRPADQR